MVTGGEWTSGTISWDNMPAAETLLQENISHNNLTKYQFSCLTAVRHWYDGDITGQNENYGVMIRYYDETIADYNSVFSADYTVATQRPTMTISYTPASSSVEVDKGGTKTLTVAGVTGTVTWTSADPSVATVDANGVVTGVELGMTTITASVGDTDYHTFSVRVTIADGVYRIDNVAGLCLGTYGGIAENTLAKMRSTSESGLDILYRLWDITYLGNGYYSIRPMHKLDMGLHASGKMGSAVDIVYLGTSDELDDVPLLCRWGISPTADGSSYFINHIGTGSLAMTVDEDSLTDGVGVITDIGSDTQGNFMWTLTNVNVLPSGAILYDTATGNQITSPRQIRVGETKSLSDLNLLPICYSGGMNYTNFMWVTADSSVTVNRDTGSVTGVSVGEATIIGSFYQNGRYHYVSYTINIATLLIYQTENTYYYDKDGHYAEDLMRGDMTEYDLRALDWVSWADFWGYTPAMHRYNWEYMCTNTFSTGELETVILDMIDHFMDGTGSPYSNSVLTQNAYEHDSTQEYIKNVKEQLELLLNECNGDIDALAYSAGNRGSNPLVQALRANNVYQPVYNTALDKITGLTICVDGLWGNKIEVSSYSISGGSYSCTLHYTLYDHFGLDQADVEKYGYLAGFRSWYVLQHYSEYHSAYKPFLTVIEFDVTISGSI